MSNYSLTSGPFTAEIAVANGKILDRSVDLNLTLDDFQKVSDQVPLLADLKPSGKYVMEDIHKVRILFSCRCLSYKIVSLGALMVHCSMHKYNNFTIVLLDKR